MRAVDYINAHRNDEDACECIIHPNGELEEARPSHAGRLLELAGGNAALLHGKMENSMEPLFWLVEFTGCMSVWQTRVVSPSEPAEEQRKALEMLHDAAFLSPAYLFEKADESYTASVRKARESMGLEARKKPGRE